MFTSYTKREIRQFHAAVVQAKKCTKQRDARASCSFADLNLLLFAVLVALAVVVA